MKYKIVPHNDKFAIKRKLLFWWFFIKHNKTKLTFRSERAAQYYIYRLQGLEQHENN